MELAYLEGVEKLLNLLKYGVFYGFADLSTSFDRLRMQAQVGGSELLKFGG